MIRVAIPRAMSYYYFFPFFKTLLTEMGVDVILSKPTTKATLQDMSVCPTDEPCLAVKLCFAHVKQLIDQNFDYIFIPKIISVSEGAYCCPKFIGIPDMISNAFNLGDKMLSPEINISRKQMADDISQIAARFGVRKSNVPSIIAHAWKVQENISKLMTDEQITVEEAFEVFASNGRTNRGESFNKACNFKIGIIGHPYVLYEWISHGLINRFRQYGKVLTPEMVDKSHIKEQMKHVYEGDKLWTFEAQLLGAAMHFIKNERVDRLVLAGMFECGPESIIEAYIEEEAEKLHMPLLKLFMDEQTGEAGLVTRVEAFMDTGTENMPDQDQLSPSSANKPKRMESKPIVGYPSMGHLDIVINTVLNDCGVEIIQPPVLSRRSLELGKELAPEFVCIPFTATLGQMIELVESGANSFLMVGGKGICRLGWYAQIQELLMKRKGYEFNMFILDSPFPIHEKGSNFLLTLKQLTGGARLDKIMKSALFGYNKLKVLDNAELICRRMRAYEKQRGQVDKAFSLLKTRVAAVGDYKTLQKIQREFYEEIGKIETEDTYPLEISLLGEIWVVLEPFINMEIEKFLGSREGVRVNVHRELNMSEWFQGNVLHTGRAIRRLNEISKAANPFLSKPVGGHGQESVGLAVLAARENLDGVIHLMPFTCMPEIVAHNILTQVSDKLDIPVLSVIFSDQTGEAGIETRLEAFLDLLLERRFERKKIGVGRN